MKINYTEDAFVSLIQLVNYIESENTQGAGLRWLNRYEHFLKTRLQTPDRIRLCNNYTFTQLKLHCIYFNDWLIAFSIHTEMILIEPLLHKSRISD